MTKVLLAVDDDERYESILGATERVLRLGAGDELLLVHVVATIRFLLPPPTVFESVDDFLVTTTERLKGREWTVHYQRLEGDPAEEIVRVGRENDVDLVVLGALGQARSQDFLVGSVAEKVESLTERDLLMVRGTPGKDPKGPKGPMTLGGPVRALLAVDGSEASLEAVRSFVSLFRLDGASVRVVHVLELPSSTSVPPSWQQRADEALSAARGLLEAAGLTPEPVIARGSSAAGILSEAEDFGASLLVVGAQGLGRPLHLPALPAFRGTVRKRVARHATCSVLLAAPPARSPMKPEAEET